MMSDNDGLITCPYVGDPLLCPSQACLKKYKLKSKMKIDIMKVIGEFNDDTDELMFGQNNWDDRENRKIIIKFWSKKLKEFNKIK